MLKEAELSRGMVVMDGAVSAKWKGMGSRPQELPWIGEQCFLSDLGKRGKEIYRSRDIYIHEDPERKKSEFLCNEFYFFLKNRKQIHQLRVRLKSHYTKTLVLSE